MSCQSTSITHVEEDLEDLASPTRDKYDGPLLRGQRRHKARWRCGHTASRRYSCRRKIGNENGPQDVHPLFSRCPSKKTCPRTAGTISWWNMRTDTSTKKSSSRAPCRRCSLWRERVVTALSTWDGAPRRVEVQVGASVSGASTLAFPWAVLHFQFQVAVEATQLSPSP